MTMLSQQHEHNSFTFVTSIHAMTVTPFFMLFQPIVAPYRQVFPSEPDNQKEVDDNCSLMYLNEATLLHNLRVRYKKNKVYVSIIIVIDD